VRESGRCFSGYKWISSRAHLFGERGRSEYIEVGFKTSHWAEFNGEGRLNRPWSDCHHVCHSDWQTAAQSGQTNQDQLNRPGGG
jgi:hypothetical protein